MEKTISVTYHKDEGEGYKVGICRRQQFSPGESEVRFFENLVKAVHELPEITTDSMHLCYVPKKHCQFYWVNLCECHPKKAALEVAKRMSELARKHFHKDVKICQA